MVVGKGQAVPVFNDDANHSGVFGRVKHIDACVPVFIVTNAVHDCIKVFNRSLSFYRTVGFRAVHYGAIVKCGLHNRTFSLAATVNILLHHCRNCFIVRKIRSFHRKYLRNVMETLDFVCVFCYHYSINFQIVKNALFS